MCHFMFWADIDGPRWVLMGLVVKLAHSVCSSSFLTYFTSDSCHRLDYVSIYFRVETECLCFIDRDSGRWNLDADETHRRRCLLYEIYTYDSWQVL